MKGFKKKSKSDELRAKWKKLINDIHNNHPESGGANRAAVAELQARSALELNKATKGLKTATWILAFSTVVLCVITLISG
jgi:hypothetical protein